MTFNRFKEEYFNESSQDDKPKPRALGGPVTARDTYLIGEKGPELFSPDQSGNIIPNNKLRTANPTASLDTYVKRVMGNLSNQLGNVSNNNPAVTKNILTTNQTTLAQPAADTRNNFSGMTFDRAIGSLNEDTRTSFATGPKTSYKAMPHGTEAMAPLEGSSGIPVDMSGQSKATDDQVGLLREQVSKLDQVISILSRSNNINNKILSSSYS